MSDIFIIYSHKDYDYLEKLDKQFKILQFDNKGISFFSDKYLKTGDIWDDTLKTELKNSKFVVILISDNSLSSDYVQKNELPLCIGSNKKIFGLYLTNTSIPEFLKKIQLFPTNNGKLKALSELQESEKDMIISDFANKVFNNIRIDNPIFDANTLLITEPERYGRIKAELFNNAIKKEESLKILKEIVDEYLHYFKIGRQKEVIGYINSFDSNVDVHKKRIVHQLYPKINIYEITIELLKKGLPKPTHLSKLASIKADDLLYNPAYAIMLEAMLNMESDHHKMALDLLEQIKDEALVQNCVLYQNLKAKSYRKTDMFNNAKASYDNGIKFIEKGWPHELCPCFEKCNENALKLELYRGLGTVYRKLKDFRQAEASFIKALEFSTPENASEISQVYFSYGYLLFEEAFKEVPVLKVDELNKSFDNFNKSYSLNPKFTAPLSRLAIISLYEKEYIKSYGYLLKVFELDSLNRQNVENDLTHVWCNIIKYQLINSGLINEIMEMTPENIRNDFQKALNKDPDIATLECHFFDTQVVFEIFKYLNYPIIDKFFISVIDNFEDKINKLK